MASCLALRAGTGARERDLAWLFIYPPSPTVPWVASEKEARVHNVFFPISLDPSIDKHHFASGNSPYEWSEHSIRAFVIFHGEQAFTPIVIFTY